jgi:hypothetical protein
MLEEIVLIDDGSNTTEITKLLPLYLKHRLADQVLGLKKLFFVIIDAISKVISLVTT